MFKWHFKYKDYKETLSFSAYESFLARFRPQILWRNFRNWDYQNKTAELSKQTCLGKTKFYQSSNLDPTIYGILEDQFKSRSFSSGQLYV